MPVPKQLILLHSGDWELNNFQAAQRFASESSTLATLRDTLLPKLLSGEISTSSITIN